MPYLVGVQAAQILLVAIAAFFRDLYRRRDRDDGQRDRPHASLQGCETVVAQYAAVPPAGRKAYADAAKARVKAWLLALAKEPAPGT